MEAIIAVGVIAVVLFVSVVVLLKNILYICQPNEVLIFSGGTHKCATTGRVLGYRVVKGGRGFKIPMFERVARMDLTNMAIDVTVRGAFSKGGIPLSVQGVANVKVAGTQPTLDNAIERFLGKPRADIQRIAQENLEGNLRGVLATLTPEQVNEDKISFAQSLLEEGDADLRKLGLVLDTLKIQNVHDDVGYLDSIGRKQSADVRKKALIAEALSKSQARVRDAENKEETACARVDSQLKAVEAEMNRRIIDAKTKGPALAAEQESVVESAIAKTEAEIKMQTARVEQVSRQLEADVVLPAQAEMLRQFEDARAGAATIIEDGAATTKALREVIEAWLAAGVHARDIFLLQKLDNIMKTVVSTIDNVQVQKVTMVDGGGSGGVDTNRLVSANEQIKASLGVDIPALVNAIGRRS